MNRTGLVLAGGASQRFGERKPLALFERVPMVRRVADVLATRCDEVLVSIAVQEDERRFEAALPNLELIRDERGDRGPIEGFRRGFAVARGAVVLVAPSDAPLLQPTIYDALLGILGDREAAVPRHASMDPVRAVYRRDAVLRILATEDVVSPSALVDRLDAVFLEGKALSEADPSRASFVDVNRPEDLREAQRLAAARP